MPDTSAVQQLYAQLLNTIGATDQVSAMRELARLHALDLSAQNAVAPPPPAVVKQSLTTATAAFAQILFRADRMPPPDADGFFSHPDLECFCTDYDGVTLRDPGDEGIISKQLLAAVGFDCETVELGDDVPDDHPAYIRYFETGGVGITDWTPTPPEGEGWRHVGSWDTEDGPVAMFVRPRAQATTEESSGVAQLNDSALQAQLDRMTAQWDALPDWIKNGEPCPADWPHRGDAPAGERERFEAWATGETIDVSRGPNTYKYPSARFAWASWQARAALDAPRSGDVHVAPAPAQGSTVGLYGHDREIARCGATNLPMLADEIDCQDETHPCENCGPMCPDTGAIECRYRDSGECANDKAEELREVAKLLGRLYAAPVSAPAQVPHTDAQLDEILERPVCEGESVGIHLHHGCNVPGSNQSTRLLMREVLRTILRGVSAPATQPGPAEFTEDRRRAYAPAKIAGPEDMAIYDGIARRYLDSFEPMVPATPGARIIPRGFVDGSAGAPADARDADSDAELIEALHINLKAAREFADRNSRDARRYRIVRRGQHWSVVDGSGEALRAEALDVAVDIYVDRAFGVNGTPECGSEQDERDREVGRKWRTNSALEEWFPLTADQLARAEADSKRIDYIAREYLEITPFNMPTGADDADVGWRIYEFHQSAPHKSLVAEEFRDDLRAAIDRAMGGES